MVWVVDQNVVHGSWRKFGLQMVKKVGGGLGMRGGGHNGKKCISENQGDFRRSLSLMGRTIHPSENSTNFFF